MRHLTLPFYCVLVASFLLALLLRAIWTGAHTFTLIFLVGFLYFAARAFVETRTAWPTFRDQQRRLAEERRRQAQQRRCRLPDDIH